MLRRRRSSSSLRLEDSPTSSRSVENNATISLDEDVPSTSSNCLPARRIKIISMGDGGVGKSCLIKRYCEEQFVSKYIATIGIDYGVKAVVVAGLEVRVNFWDLSGHPEFYDVRNEFYKDTQGALLLFDVTSRASFEGLSDWLDEAAQFSKVTHRSSNSSNSHAAARRPSAATLFPCIVCGNKTDLTKKRVVSTEEGERWAAARGFDYFETSAKVGHNVDAALNTLFTNVVQLQHS